MLTPKGASIFSIVLSANITSQKCLLTSLKYIFLSFYIFNTIYHTRGTKMKNIKISKEVHDILKQYCLKEGMKIHKFVEKLIISEISKKGEKSD